MESLPGCVLHENSLSFQLHEQLPTTEVFQNQVELFARLECIDQIHDERMLCKKSTWINIRPKQMNSEQLRTNVLALASFYAYVITYVSMDVCTHVPKFFYGTFQESQKDTV